MADPKSNTPNEATDMEHDHILIRDCKIEAGPDYAIGIVIAAPHPASAAHKVWFDQASYAEQDAHLLEHEKRVDK